MFQVGQHVLLVYPEGDCDEVEILEVHGDGKSIEDWALVKLPDGSHAFSIQENLAAFRGQLCPCPEHDDHYDCNWYCDCYDLEDWNEE